MRGALKTVVLVSVAFWVAPGSATATTTTLGAGGWQVQSSAQAGNDGAAISGPAFDAGSWLHVHPDDAGAPGTEVGALVQTGHCPEVFFSTNMKTCFGYMTRVGPNTIPMFQVPWWFRTTFVAHLGHSEHAQLVVNGVVGKADVWCNGQQIASQATVEGDYTRYTFDITDRVHAGVNGLAFEIYPNDPSSMFTVDNIDWTQVPPDNNTGIQFPVALHISGPLSISDIHVLQNDARHMTRSALTLKGVIHNDSATRQGATVSATLTGGRSGIGESQPVRLAAGATHTVNFRVLLRHPRVWWPYQMGSQPLYSLRMSVSEHGQLTDSGSETFGIRTVSSRLIGPSPLVPHGSRQFLINGRPFVFRGGAWSEDLFLRYSTANAADQIALIKNLGLDAIRTEGKQMPPDFYEQMDRAGILIDGGFQCCDAWQLQESQLTSAHDFSVLYNSARTIGENLRNHPSVLNFSWSDDNPVPGQEQVSLEGFRQADFQDPLIASAEYKRGAKLGWSGEKEGPYDWVPPSYWYDSTHYDHGDPTRTNTGGAWGFDSEASAGHTVPTLDSLRRFLAPFEQAQLWENPSYNQYHTNYEPQPSGPDTGGYSFGTLRALDQAIAHRYGSWSGLAQYVEEAQVQNYETQRAEFEAYIDHSTRRAAPSTGIDYWMLNPAWPTLLWSLYNQDLDEPGSYFGAKKANESVHVLYAYDSGTAAVDNLTGRKQSHLSVEANVYALDGTRLDHRSRSGIALRSQGVATGLLRPAVPAATTPPAPAKVYFIELVLRQRGRVIERNVYWFSTQPDVIDWPQSIGSTHAFVDQFADLRGLQGLPAAHVSVTARTHHGGGGRDITEVTIRNTSASKTVAFFVRADVRRGSAAGSPLAGDNEVLPVFWSDDDITLWPRESQTLQVSYRRAELHGASPVVSISGWNVPAMNKAAK